MLNRREQVVLLLLTVALVAGSVVAMLDYYRCGTVEDLRIVPGAVTCPAPLAEGVGMRPDSMRPDSTTSAVDAGTEPLRRMDLNSASAADLQALPGIGPKTASRILEFRRRQGPFSAVADLQRVRGIGARTLARVQPWLMVVSGKQRDSGGSGGEDTKSLSARARQRPSSPPGD